METYAERILIKRVKKQAYGVLIKMKGMLPKRIYADKEVILCAGAIQSPQLLMVSGVGPKDHLRKMGIPVVLDAKGVGMNLQVLFYATQVKFNVFKSFQLETGYYRIMLLWGEQHTLWMETSPMEQQT